MSTETPETTITNLRKKLRLYQFLCAVYTLALLVGAGYYGSSKLIKPVYEVRVDGKLIAATQSRSAITAVLAQIKQEKAGGLGQSSDFVQQVSVHRALFSHAKPVSADALKPLLKAKLALKVPAWVIMANDNPAAALPREQDAREVLKKYEQKFTKGKKLVAEPRIKEHVTIQKMAIDPEAVFETVDEGVEALGTSAEDSTHVVADGENAWTIARKYGMDPRDLEKLNPGRNLDRLSIGDQLTVSESKPAVTVETVERESFTQQIPYSIRTIENDRVLKGKVFIKQAGHPGRRRIQQLVTRENGVVVHRDTESTRILSQAQDEIKVIGTMPPPQPKPYRRHRHRR